MTDAKSPFDDPDGPQLPPGLDIRHWPGAATDLMQQLAPLLADEGIDIAHLDDADPVALKAALQRAVERHNLEASTPIGEQRARTITTLRELVIAHHARNTAASQMLFGSIGPVPTRHRPSSGHLTGVNIETLDTIFGNEQLHPALHVIEIPKVDPTTRAAAQHLLGLAAKARAFRSLDALLATHGSFEISRAGVLLLTAVIQAVAKHRGVDVEATLDELLPIPTASQSTTAAPTPQESTAQTYEADFETWLKTQSEVADIATKVIEIFATMVADARQLDLNPHDPAAFDDWMLIVQEHTDPNYLGTALEIVKYYVQFRLRTSIEPDRWHHAHAHITDLTVPHEKSPWDFESIFAMAQQVEPAQRYESLVQLSIVSGARELYEWLATPRQVTEAGAPHREGIDALSGMIGLELHDGVAEPPAPAIPGHVQSALEIPELMVWWRTLQELGILQVTDGMAVRGPAAAEYVGSEHIPFDGAEGLVATYLKILLIHGLQHAPFEISSVGHTIARLLNALQGMPPMRPPAADDFRAQLVHQRSDEYLQSMAAFGLIVLSAGEPEVPDTLAAAVFYGLMMAMDHLDDLLDEQFS